jgi:serine/threonine protein kinase
MPLLKGSRLGPYEILDPIGSGGMGEVYRAHDPKLGRDVALKILPEKFAREADRMERFGREAKVLASLNHANIASIYGFEDSGSTRALVMELVEGPTLADRIKAGPIPIDEVLPIAKQICEALEYAHERAIVHRDLKPANVKVTADDTVKILDFGLAKALEGDAASADIATSPTISRMATMAGVLLGTAAYMSPEQAKGKPVDRRADIWAFGCVLYEMQTGKMAFRGETVTDTLAAVIKEEPDWSQLPAATPPHVRVLLRRCLQKDPKQRLRDIGDARISLDEALSGAPEPVSVVREKPAAPAELMRFEIPLPEKAASATSGTFALSPDGRQLAFAAAGPDSVQRLWVRPLDSLEARPLPGSESLLFPPFFWSHDSRFIAFDAGGKLKKIDIFGGPAQTLCDLRATLCGGSWNRDGVIIFGQARGALMRVSARGGPASRLTTLDPSRREAYHAFPSFLPDGRHFIYLRPGKPENSGVYVGSLNAGPEEQSSKRLVATVYGPAYVPSSDAGSDQLLFLRDGVLMTQSFDASRLELAGEPLPVAERLGFFLSFGFFSVSINGVLVYRAAGGGVTQQLTCVDREGKFLDTVGEPGGLYTFALCLSPDGARAVVSRTDSSALNPALWLVDFSRRTSTRFTFGAWSALSGAWSPDGSRIIFASNRSGVFDLYLKLASGAKDEELLLKSSEIKFPASWSRDGRFLLYVTGDHPRTKDDLWVLPLEGDKKPFPFLRTEFNNFEGQFSPDGRWVSYTSDESGRMEIYVRTFSPDSTAAASDTGGKWLISTGGGSEPRWRGDGKELYYLAPDGKLMAVEIATDPVFQAGVPKALFQTPPRYGELRSIWHTWDLTSDGKRFLFVVPTERAPFTVVLNWQAALLKK